MTANLKKYAGEEFPDNTQEAWEVLGFEHRDDQTIVEAKPATENVGYPLRRPERRHPVRGRLLL